MDDKDNKQQQAPINVWGVANIGCTIENPTYQTLVVPPEEQRAQEADAEEDIPAHPHEHEEVKVNTATPRIVLQRMLEEEWFEKVCADKALYNKEWRNRMVSDLMVSEHGVYIAGLWEHKDKIQTIKAKLVGSLASAGVLKGSNLAIARAYLDIVKNTRDESEKKEASTFANYMGQCWKEPYHEWIVCYVGNAAKKQ